MDPAWRLINTDTMDSRRLAGLVQGLSKRRPAMRPRSLKKLKYLSGMSLHDIRRLARRKLPGLPGGAPWTAQELMASAKYARGVRFAELLMRQEAILRRESGRPPIDFAGANVIEVGCGPLAGFGPLAIFRGAQRFESAEPEWAPEMLEHPLVVEKYLRVMHADYSALYGPLMAFEGFRQALRDRMTIHTAPFGDAPITQPGDVILSQSVVEHVFPPESLFTRIRAVSTPDARHLHLVDFGNHYPTPSPFDGLYTVDAATYLAERPGAINLLRANEIAALAAEAGLNATLTPVRRLPLPAGIDASWRARATDDDLGVQLALLAN